MNTELTEKDKNRFYLEIGRLARKKGKLKQDECWEWEASLSDRGYGRIWINGRHEYAHRVSYLLRNGTIDDSLDVLHSCDNPPCVNPNHLRQGTKGDNVQDMWDRERRDSKGEKCVSAKIIQATADLVRTLYQSGKSKAAIAREVGLSQRQVGRICRNEQW